MTVMLVPRLKRLARGVAAMRAQQLFQKGNKANPKGKPARPRGYRPELQGPLRT